MIQIHAHRSHRSRRPARLHRPGRQHRRILRDRVGCGDRRRLPPRALRLCEALDHARRGQRNLRRHGARHRSARQELHRRAQLSADRESQQDPRALHDLARHAAGVGDRDRRRQLHHDVGPYRAQLQDRQPHGDLQLRAGGGPRRGGGWRVHLRRRGDPPVLEDRQSWR